MNTVPVQEPFVFQSKRGFHPCDYPTFKKLKELHKAYWKAVRGLAAWFRWNAKQPQNRKLFRRIKNENGKITGKEIIGTWQEPRYCPLFGEPNYKSSYKTIPEHLDDHGIVAAYQQARMPVAKELVATFKSSYANLIDELYEKLKA